MTPALSEAQRGSLQRTLGSPGWLIVQAIIDKEIQEAKEYTASTANTMEEVLERRFFVHTVERILRDLYHAVDLSIQ